LDIKFQFIEKLFIDILNYSYLLPLFFLVLYFKRVRGSAFLVVFSLYFTTFFCLNFFYDDVRVILSRKEYYAIYTSLEFSAFVFFLWSFIQERKIKNLIVVLSAVFVAFVLIYFLTAHYQRIDSIPIGIETILIFVFIFYYFYQYFKTSTAHSIYEDYSFWLITGMFIYLGGTFFFNILANDIATQSTISKLWYLTFIGDVIKNVLCSVAIVLYLKKPSTESKHSSVPYLDLDII
jgi:hypothetical protein